MTTNGTTTILVVGSVSPLLEGLRDLLQLSGYRAVLASSWVEAEPLLASLPPSLTIVDLSGCPGDDPLVALPVPERSAGAAAPVLFVSFGPDEALGHLRRTLQSDGNGQVKLYSCNLLGAAGLLDQVTSILSSA